METYMRLVFAGLTLAAVLLFPADGNAKPACGWGPLSGLCRLVQHREPAPDQNVDKPADRNSSVTYSFTSEEIEKKRFKRFKLNEVNEDRGYVRIGFALTDGEKPYVELGNSRSFLARSIVDWAKRFFTRGEKIVLVNLEVLKNGDVIWSTPVASLEFNEDISLIEMADDRILNGSTGFYNFSNQELVARISAYYAEATNINKNRVKSFFDLSRGVFSVFGNIDPSAVVSVFDVSSNISYTRKIDQMMANLDGFARVEAISRSATFKYERGSIGRMTYHFFAKHVRFAPFVLSVNMEYKNSLLTSTSPSDIMGSPIYNKGIGAFQPIESYITSHNSSRLAVGKITDKNTLLEACVAVRDALNDVLVARDVAFVLNAYILEKPDVFRKEIWRDDCLTISDRKFLIEAGADVAYSYEKFEPPIQAASDAELESYASAVGTLFIVSKDTAKFAGNSVIELSRQGDGEDFSVVDEVGVLFTPPATTRPQYPIDLAERLINVGAIRFGCISRRLRSTDANPNIISLLVKLESQEIIDVTLKFEASPSKLSDPKLESARLRVLDANVQKEFQKACPNSSFFEA